MTISDHISAAHVILDASPSNKADLLEFLATEAASRIGHSRQDTLNALQAREQIGSTALGKGVALPHAELRGAESSLVLFARLLRPINFDARDDEPVDLVFLVLWPATDRKGLLPVMSEICQALRDPQSLRRLRLAKTPEDVVQLVLEASPTNPEQGGKLDEV
ncbi:PTS sugar transporter subunit IIA [Azospirillum doebereinerae]